MSPKRNSRPWSCRRGVSPENPQQARAFDVAVEPGKTLVEGPFVAESVQVTVEESYLVVDL